MRMRLLGILAVPAMMLALNGVASAEGMKHNCPKGEKWDKTTSTCVKKPAHNAMHTTGNKMGKDKKPGDAVPAGNAEKMPANAAPAEQAPPAGGAAE